MDESTLAAGSSELFKELIITRAIDQEVGDFPLFITIGIIGGLLI